MNKKELIIINSNAMDSKGNNYLLVIHYKIVSNYNGIIDLLIQNYHWIPMEVIFYFHNTMINFIVMTV